MPNPYFLSTVPRFERTPQYSWVSANQNTLGGSFPDRTTVTGRIPISLPSVDRVGTRCTIESINIGIGGNLRFNGPNGGDPTTDLKYNFMATLVNGGGNLLDFLVSDVAGDWIDNPGGAPFFGNPPYPLNLSRSYTPTIKILPSDSLYLQIDLTRYSGATTGLAYDLVPGNLQVYQSVSRIDVRGYLYSEKESLA